MNESSVIYPATVNEDINVARDMEVARSVRQILDQFQQACELARKINLRVTLEVVDGVVRADIVRPLN